MDKKVKKGIKVLFVNPIEGMEGFLPLGISVLSSVLKKAGHKVRLFDTTFFETQATMERDIGEKELKFKKVDMSQYGVYDKRTNLKDEFLKTINAFNPDVITVSVATSYNYPLAKKLIRYIPNDYSGLVVVGGKHPTVAPEEVINESRVDVICIGEGEQALLELCNRIKERGYKDITNIKNLWVKQGKKVFKNEIGPLPDINSLPFPDWTIFDERHFYRPFQGKVYRYGHVEMSRGCPNRCPYCINEYLQNLFKGKGLYHRRKAFPQMIEEVKFLKEKYDLEMIKFWDETFLLMSTDDLRKLATLYKPLNLPFLITTRPETINYEKALILKEMGCVAASIGIESGNPYIRKEILKRGMSNEVIINAFHTLKKVGIHSSAFNMIGLPYETRENIFETIELNKKAKADTACVCVFVPFKGTKLLDTCIKEGFIKNSQFNVISYHSSMLDMPQISKEEIENLKKTFLLYVHFPKIFYPLIRLCEKDNAVSNFIFKILTNVYYYIDGLKDVVKSKNRIQQY